MRRSWLPVLLGLACVHPAASRAGAESGGEPNVKSFLGCWQTAEPAPIVILKGGQEAGGYDLLRESMLLSLARIEKTDLVKGHYYAFSADRKVVIGPEYVDGAFNPAEGVLTVGEPEGGLNRVHLLSADRMLYVHTKAAETADMSVRHLERVDCAEAEATTKKLRARAGEAGGAGPNSPGQGESCLPPPHACTPEATLDCVWFPERSICGTNHVWLNVAHNRLSLPLSASRNPCDAHFDDLNVAKWTCQSIAECRGITRDHGVTCDGVVKEYELRRGVLWDTTPDGTFNSWVRRDFQQRADTELVDPLPDGAADPCAYRFETLDSAKAACRLTQGCHGVVQDAGASCGGRRKTFALRSGGQTGARGSTTWIYRVQPAQE